MRGLCSAEQKQGCPLMHCLGSDLHHAIYPANAYNTKVEKAYRDLAANKVQLSRCVHQAIHASGYIPEKLSRDEMLQEIWAKEPTERSQVELERQLTIAELVMTGKWPPKEAA